MATHIATLADLLNKYTELGSVKDTGIFQDAYIPQAEDYIESRLSLVYPVPFTGGCLTVVALVVDFVFATYTMVRDAKRGKAVLDRVENMLDDIVAGKMNLYSNGEQLSRTSLLWSSTETYTPVFGVGDITDFEVDPDQISDEEDNRI